MVRKSPGLSWVRRASNTSNGAKERQCFWSTFLRVFFHEVPTLAAVPQPQIFSLTGALLLLPRVLAYTAFVTWTFRGKIADGGGYR